MPIFIRLRPISHIHFFKTTIIFLNNSLQIFHNEKVDTGYLTSTMGIFPDSHAKISFTDKKFTSRRGEFFYGL